MPYFAKHTRCCLLLLMWLFSSIGHAGEVEPIDDLFVGVWSPFAARWEKTVPVCIWSDSDDTSYRVIVSGIQPGNKFLLTNDVGDTIPYKVFWHTGSNFKRRERLYPNRASKRSYSYKTSEKCGGVPSSQLRVRIVKKKLNAAPAAIYQDTILVMLSPL